jgi:hypothetical protein
VDPINVSGINFENPGFWVCVAVGISVAIWSTVKGAADYWHSAARGALAVQQRQTAEMRVRLVSVEAQRCAARDALAVARQQLVAANARLDRRDKDARARDADALVQWASNLEQQSVKLNILIRDWRQDPGTEPSADLKGEGENLACETAKLHLRAIQLRETPDNG